jgi:flagellar protein FlgJ
MSTELEASHVYTDFQALAGLRRRALQNSPEALRAMAKQFEAYLVQQLVRSGREANLGDGIFDNKGSSLFQDMFDKQIALAATQGKGLGIADMLVKQLEQAQRGTGNQGISNSTAKSEGTAGQGGVAPPTPQDKTTRLPLSSVAVELARLAPSASNASEVPAITPVRFDTPREFVSAVMPHARSVGAELGVDPRLLVAQAALETGWGKSIIRNSDGTSSHNLFNIKAHGGWKGPVASARTTEYENGAKVKIRDGFRSYESFAHSFRDYVAFLRENPRYGEVLQQTVDPAAFAHALQKAGYATDPKYADKILAIYRKTGLVASVS